MRVVAKWIVYCAVFPLLGSLATSQARAEKTPAQNPSAFAEYISQVERENLELLAQRYAVPIAEAQIDVAKVFPDPSLQGGLLAYDVSGQG